MWKIFILMKPMNKWSNLCFAKQFSILFGNRHRPKFCVTHLYTSCGDIDTTTNHPFYVLDKGWVAAGDLVEGDEIYLLDGSTAYITGSDIEKLDELIKVYNFEV